MLEQELGFDCCAPAAMALAQRIADWDYHGEGIAPIRRHHFGRATSIIKVMRGSPESFLPLFDDAIALAEAAQ